MIGVIMGDGEDQEEESALVALCSLLLSQNITPRHGR